MLSRLPIALAHLNAGNNSEKLKNESRQISYSLYRSKKLTAQRRNQEGQGLKILTPSQMLSRLPIALAQLNAGNNSEKIKKEIRQISYSLYR